ncbi:hypothetical protein [Chryseobacterium indoltheticum]|uniref:Uncharacterized protein n=1 Tax=Chryseobacterium indoltheticum TaxID=254 RepID=A0A381FAG4_9FLAO|nr:hypothetical protein [Chryseobacterium indoltheticum]SUX43454.1 Uncharacterised protein [Chryseobacterium indoltheticum]
MRTKVILNSIIALTIGTLIYLLFRVSTLKIFSWINVFEIDFTKCKLRDLALSYSAALPQWFIFSLPDGLWAFSYTSIMLCIWDFKINSKNIFWILLIPLIAIISEIGQKIKIVSGTYDHYDLLFYIMGFIMPIAFFTKTINFKNYNL